MFTGSFEPLYVGLAKKIEAVPDGRAVNRRSGGPWVPTKPHRESIRFLSSVQASIPVADIVEFCGKPLSAQYLVGVPPGLCPRQSRGRR